MKKVALLFIFTTLLFLTNCENLLIEEDGGVIKKSGTITEAEIWSNTNAIYEASAVHINSTVIWGEGITVLVKDRVDINSNGSLIIQQGVTVKFDEDAYLEVGNNSSGTLIAEGTSTSKIRFTANNSGRYWGYGYSNDDYSGGLWFSDGTTFNSKLRHCIIEYAKCGIYATNCYFAIDSCIITNNRYLGINFTEGSYPDTATRKFAGNIITANGRYPLRMAPVMAGNICDGNILTGNGSGYDAIDIKHTGSIESNSSVVWRNHGIPYIVNYNFDINENGILTIMPGVTVRFNTGAYIDVGSGGTSGTLIANGTPVDSIVFTHNNVGAYWGYGNANSSYSGGIWCSAGTTMNTSITYAIIEYARSGIYLDANITVTNCRLANNQNYGIVYEDAAYIQTGNTFANNGIGQSVVR